MELMIFIGCVILMTFVAVRVR